MQKITIEDEKYPEKLKQIKNPPKQLYYQGDITLLNENIISIVGSRNCTDNGRKLTKKFASELVEQELVIASGMAKGIDSVAHETTIESKGKTIAVLGSGLNQIFPKENARLYNKIVENGGLVISEYSPKTTPTSQFFLDRNRIVSGISMGILVVEATFRSGTSVTARLANEQNRKVFVLPHEINDNHGVGTNQLIRKGAILITTTKEIIDEFKFLTYKKKNKRKAERKSKPTNNKHQEIYELIGTETLKIEEIYRKSTKTIQEINQIILIMEIEGYIEKVAGGYRCT